MTCDILDLSPENAMVRSRVGQGFIVVVISWINPTSEHRDLSLKDCRKRGVTAALDAGTMVVPETQVPAVGHWLGGTVLAIAAATMARDGDDRLGSVMRMAAQVDFAEAGKFLVFLDESPVAARTSGQVAPPDSADMGLASGLGSGLGRAPGACVFLA